MRWKPLHRYPSGNVAASQPRANGRMSATRAMPTAKLCFTLLLLAIFLATGHITAGEAEIDASTGSANPVEEAQATEGELYWGDGHHYRGGLKAGNQMHGRGIHTAPDGEVYAGDFADGQRHGEGSLTFPNGDVYEGDFHFGAMTGRGRLTWSNGDVYEGDFLDGVRQGRGVLERQSGGTYVGDFSGDQRHGKGRYRWRDGTLYRGHFAFGKLHRSGVKTSPGGELSFETWNDGQLTATVPVAAVERCSLNLEGKPWMFNDGTCINGLAHGEGLAVALDGSAYVLNGRFILGSMVRGEIRSVELEESP